MKKLGLLLMGLLLGAALAQAQTLRVSGTVTGAEDGMPLPGVSVIVKGTTIGTATDMDGKYTLNVPSDAQVLQFSYIGYATQEVALAGRTNGASIDVVMQSAAEEMEEIVVTGYGVVRKSAFTGAASAIDGEKLGKTTSTNPIKALEGNVTGMIMSQFSGQPGAPTTIFIRGRNSLNSGTQPLYIIDGVPMEATAQGMRGDEGIEISPLSSLNPDDIESMTVLKDATATSIYGSRAANGVIVITTKQGKKGTFKVNATAKWGLDMMPIIPKSYRMVNAQQYLELKGEALINDDYATTMEDAIDFFYAAALGTTKDDPYWNADTDWLNELTRRGFNHEYSLDISGGGAESTSAKYFFSMGYLGNEAIVLGKGMNRLSTRLNLEQSPYKWLGYGVNTSISQTKISMGSSGGSFSDPITGAFLNSPLSPVKVDGEWNTKTLYGFNSVAARSEQGDKQQATQNRIIVSPHIRLNFTDDLFFVSRLGIDAYLLKEFGFWSMLGPDGPSYNGKGEQGATDIYMITNTNTLNYVKTLSDDHNVNLMLGYEAQRTKVEESYLSASNYAVDFLNDISLASKPTDAKTYQREQILQSIFFNGQYDFQNKYYLSASYRMDGSSRFIGKNYWSQFWSVGAKYRISAEDFMSSTEDWLNTLVIRASYGTTGNQNVGSGYYPSRGLAGFGYNYNGLPGIIPVQLANNKLTWEFTSKFNVGIDITLFDRVFITADYYNHQTKDMVFEVPISMTTGFANADYNIGQLQNQGVEMSLTTNIIKGDRLDWSITLNGSHNQNKLVKLSTDKPIEGELQTREVGRDIYSYKMKEWAGVDPETGEGLWYKNETGDETTNNYNEAAKRFVGIASPKFEGSFSSNLSFMGIDFSVLLTTSLGRKIYGDNLRYEEGTMGLFAPHTQWVYDNRWQKPGDKAKVPAMATGSYQAGLEETSSRYLMNGNYLKIKSISLGYNLPKSVLEPLHMQSLRIFAQAENLYTFHHKDFRGFDPSSVGANGIQFWNYPQARSFTLGLTIGF